ncbi:MAG: NAD-dependent epimerase/dehydratase family protein [Lentisphaerae bacterium]|nr:NAD-dependent epimerase/dehydratase family protein [Lentisphaerota bacterium]
MKELDTQPQTYLVTGGAGFIGSHLCELLLSKGHRVLALDNLSTGLMSNIEPLRGNPLFEFCRDNVMSEVVLDRLASQSDIIIHFAASVGVERIISNPVETIHNNVAGTEAVLQAALRYGCRVLVASTSEVYGKGARIPFSEDDDVLLGPSCRNRWSYAASKMVDEFLALAYCHEYDLPAIVVRFFNTVGPRQSGQYGMVVPRFVRQAVRGAPISVYGDGTQQRCFCDVSDVIRAVELLSVHPEATNRVFNIGGQEEISIGALAERVVAVTGSSSPIQYIPYDQAYAPGFEDMARRVPDTTRVEQLIGWKPTLMLQDILERVRDHIAAEEQAASAS